jgi:PAS domain S-box-containing protein
MLALVGIAFDGLKEWFRADLPRSIHAFHVLLALLIVLFLAVVAFAIEHFTRYLLSSRIIEAHDRLSMAMAFGQSVGWDSDRRTGRIEWFGDLQGVFGISAETFTATAEDFYRYVHPDDREDVAEAVSHAANYHAPYSTEFRIIREDASVRWLGAKGKFYYGANGSADRMLGIAVDITDRKRIEEALLRKESQLAEAQKLAHMGSWQWNPQTNQLTWSEELYALHGLDPRLPPPSVDDLAKFFSPESWRRLREVMTEAAKTGTVRDIDVELIRPDGSKRWITARGQVGVDADGKLVSFSGTAQDITDRKRIEDQLHQSEQRLRLAVQAGKMFVYEWDPATDIVVRSPEAIQVLGEGEPLQLTRAELLTRVSSGLEDFEHSYANLIPENPATQTTYRFVRVDGTTVWLENSTKGIFDKDGQLVKVVGVVADITERKQVEHAVLESEERFRRVVEHIEDALAVDDRDGHILFANNQFLNLFGFVREELPHITFEDYVGGQYLEKARDRHHQRMRGEPVANHYEYQALRRDGTKIWVDAEIVSIKNEKGEFVGTQKLLRDATERKRAEQVLRESEERFRLMANSAPVMIWLSGIDKLCTYFNKQWLEFTGRPLEAELGNGWAERVHPDDLDKCLQTYVEAFDRRERFEMQYRLQRHDGEYRWIFDIGVPRFSADGAFAGYIGSSIDITEQRVAQKALANMGRKLMEAHEEERTWIGRELHDDINQRLSLVAVELDRCIQEFSSSTPELPRHMRQTQERIIEISTDVQALSHRLHSSKLEYLGLATAARSFCREFAERHNVQINFKQTGTLLTLPKEASLSLFRVLQEALQNALKYSRVQDFKVELHGTSHSVELRVSDAGIGFEEQEAMARGGLGLISMRERLQLVNGEFTVRSQPGRGTTISAWVPLKSDEHRAMAG